MELISALQTSPETLERARAFAVACGKGTSPAHLRARRWTVIDSFAAEVTTSQDVPGFVSNALLMPFINEVRGVSACPQSMEGSHAVTDTNTLSTPTAPCRWIILGCFPQTDRL